MLFCIKEIALAKIRKNIFEIKEFDMTDVILAAEKFAKENASVRYFNTYKCFDGVRKKLHRLKTSKSALASDLSPSEMYLLSELIKCAEKSISAIKREGKVAICGDRAYMTSLFASCILNFDNIEYKTLDIFVCECTKYHDFLLSEIEMAKDYFNIAIIDSLIDISNIDIDGIRRALGTFQMTEYINFNALFLKYAKVHMILSSERVGVYENCSDDTKIFYDEVITEKCNGNEVSYALAIVKKANENGEHVGKYLLPMRDLAKRYLWLVFVLTLFIFVVSVVVFGVLPAIISLFPIYMAAKELSKSFFETENAPLLKLCRGEKLDRERCVVAITTLLCGDMRDNTVFENLEDIYLSNPSENYVFMILGDLAESDKKRSLNDKNVLKYAASRINSLNEKYGAHFALAIRKRRFAVCERKYFGWERKRGAVIELCRYMKNGDIGSFDTAIGCENIPGIKYLLTLDSDTRLGNFGVRDILGIMLHPQNRAVFDKKSGRIVSGYGIIQPKMAVSLESSNKNLFSKISSGGGGVDRYSSCFFDALWDLDKTGVFCGKGLIDVDAFLSACDGFFPKERILSHDILEGAMARTALSKSTVMTDGTPASAPAFYARENRWIRGDLLALRYIKKHVVNESGNKIKNPMSGIYRYCLLDNVIREIAPLSAVLIMVYVAFTSPVYLIMLGYMLIPVIKSIVWAIFNIGKMNLRAVVISVGNALLDFAFSLLSIAQNATEFVLAAISVLKSSLFTKKGFLSWTTSAEWENMRKNSLASNMYSMRFSAAFGALLLLYPSPIRILGALFIIYPFLACILCNLKIGECKISTADKNTLLSYSRDMWRYFADNVNEKTNWLPPDNVQLSPVNVVAFRTSPTNIGLYLLSLLAARDIGAVDTNELYIRAENAALSVEKMARWNGHLYNWYDVKTLSVVGTPFVSTVDSGNFVTSVIAFCEGINEYAFEEAKLVGVSKRLRSVANSADFGKLWNSERGFLSIGYDVSASSLSASCYDNLMSEARTTSYYAEAIGQVPRGYFDSLAVKLRIQGFNIGAASWSGTAFEYFMPALVLPGYKGSLIDVSERYAALLQMSSSTKVPGLDASVFGISESGYFEFDNEMNYQYKAFGVEALSLNVNVNAEKVISPYSSFLMAKKMPHRSVKNLQRLYECGMYGKYGFYEAIDLDPSRVGGGYAIIKSFMSHHVGMSIISVANVCNNDIFVKRFMRDAAMRAHRELVMRKAPLGENAKRHGSITVNQIYVNPPGKTVMANQKCAYSVICPHVHMLSNNKTRVICSSSGHVCVYDGPVLVVNSEFDKFSLNGGLRTIAVIDGVLLSSAPLGYVSKGVESEYSFEFDGVKIIYRSVHRINGSEYGLDTEISLCEDEAAFSVSANIRGCDSADVAIYFEPIIDDAQAFLSHKSFSNMFLESEFYSEENAIVYRRRPRSDGRAFRYLGISANEKIGISDYDCMRENLLPLMYDASDIANAALGDLSGSDGALIVPACLLRVKKRSKRGADINVRFDIAMSNDCDDLLYFLSSEKQDAVGNVLEIQSSASGAGKMTTLLEDELLTRFAFAPPQNALSNGQIAFALSHIPMKMDSLWRRGISGDVPMVSAYLPFSEAKYMSRLFEILKLFKFSCIRGFRFDLIILFSESDEYSSHVKKAVERAVRKVGLSSFVGCRGGIFIIDINTCGDGERFLFCDSTIMHFDLSKDISILLSKENAVVAMDRERELISEITLRGDDRETGEIAKCGEMGKCEFTFVKNGAAPPWAHVISSQGFGTVVTENSLGFTFFSNSALMKLTPHNADNMREDSGERLIIRIYDENVAGQFRDYDAAACAANIVYGNGYAEYIGNIYGFKYKIHISLCGKFPVKIVKLTSESHNKNRVKIIYVTEPCLGQTPERNLVSLNVEKRGGAVRFARTISRAARPFSGAIAKRGGGQGCFVNKTALMTDDKCFFGIDDIAAVYDEYFGDGKHESVFFLAALQTDNFERYFFESIVPNYDISKRFCIFGISPVIKTTRTALDDFVNFWLPYQAMISRLYARSGYYQIGGAYGFRDQLQDVISFLSYAPDLCRIQIIRAASHQYEDGSVMHWWHNVGVVHSGIRSRCSDDSAWLAFALCEYIEKTKDTSLLYVKTPYLSSPKLSDREHERYELAPFSPKRDTVLWHAVLGVLRSAKKGAHGLPLIGTGDWNDGMNLVGAKGQGESVWLAFFISLTTKNLSKICDSVGEDELSKRLISISHEMLNSAKEAFDGNWFLRGYYDDGSPLGSIERDECKIDAIVQAFAAICADDDEKLLKDSKTALDNAKSLLFDSEHGIFRLLWPPFDDGDQSPGYIKGYVPGIRENGGQYTHAAMFSALGMLRIGKNEDGARILFSLAPIVKKYDGYKAEPYVLAGDVYSGDGIMGRGGWSWYTGAAGWYRTVFIEELCGYKQHGDSFEICPRLSKIFDSFYMEVVRGDTIYHINVSASKHDAAMIDGRDCDGIFQFDGKEHSVQIFARYDEQ